MNEFRVTIYMEPLDENAVETLLVWLRQNPQAMGVVAGQTTRLQALGGITNPVWTYFTFSVESETRLLAIQGASTIMIGALRDAGLPDLTTEIDID
jgi:hypothetical protein